MKTNYNLVKVPEVQRAIAIVTNANEVHDDIQSLEDVDMSFIDYEEDVESGEEQIYWNI